MHMLGHEVRAPQSCSLAERAALGREVQAAQHRALRLHVRLAPQDGALACAPARRELGKWVIGPTGAARVGRGGVNRSRQTRFRQGFLATEDDPRRVYPGRRPHWGSPMWGGINRYGGKEKGVVVERERRSGPERGEKRREAERRVIKPKPRERKWHLQAQQLQTS